MTDPRVFFAAERTLLAWVRTGLTIMGFGFVVARFGLFLRMLAAQPNATSIHAPQASDFSNELGIALVLVGVAGMSISALQHRRYVASLPPADLPRSHNAFFPVALALSLSALGVLLVVHLVV
jgi:putative membrane protein